MVKSVYSIRVKGGFFVRDRFGKRFFSTIYEARGFAHQVGLCVDGFVAEKSYKRSKLS